MTQERLATNKDINGPSAMDHVIASIPSNIVADLSLVLLIFHKQKHYIETALQKFAFEDSNAFKHHRHSDWVSKKAVYLNNETTGTNG